MKNSFGQLQEDFQKIISKFFETPGILQRLVPECFLTIFHSSKNIPKIF